MVAPTINIEFHEERIISRLTESPIDIGNMESLAGHFERILNVVFQYQGQQSTFRYWSVDSLWPDGLENVGNKVTLTGPVYWLVGGGACTNFQLDIAQNNTPLLYSYKLKDVDGKQIVYIGKTHKGWIVNG